MSDHQKTYQITYQKAYQEAYQSYQKRKEELDRLKTAQGKNTTRPALANTNAPKPVREGRQQEARRQSECGTYLLEALQAFELQPLVEVSKNYLANITQQWTAKLSGGAQGQVYKGSRS